MWSQNKWAPFLWPFPNSKWEWVGACEVGPMLDQKVIITQRTERQLEMGKNVIRIYKVSSVHKWIADSSSTEIVKYNNVIVSPLLNNI